MSPALPVILRGGGVLRDPRRLPGMAAWFDGMDPSTIAIDGSNRTSLVWDKSGNSAENGLVLPRVSGNYASAPNSSAVNILGSIDLRVLVFLPESVGGSQTLIAKQGTGGNAYMVRVDSAGTGIVLSHWDSGGVERTATFSGGSLFGVRQWVRVTINAANGNRQAFTSPDNATWTQYGSTSSLGGATSIITTTTAIEIGSRADGAAELVRGTIYRAQIYDGIAGTLAFDANFAAQSKLATSFTESSANAATVTINTSGATGARIAGARDLYQGTVGSQPTYSLANRTLTFDGADDFLKTAAFTLNQPTTVYFVGSQVTWTNDDRIFDGNSNNSAAIWQSDTSPGVLAYAGTIDVGIRNSEWTLASRKLLTLVFNSTASSVRINKGAPTTGSIGAVGMGGLTVGSLADGSTPSNITCNEIAIYNVAHTAAQQLAFAAYAMRKWGIR